MIKNKLMRFENEYSIATNWGFAFLLAKIRPNFQSSITQKSKTNIRNEASKIKQSVILTNLFTRSSKFRYNQALQVFQPILQINLRKIFKGKRKLQTKTEKQMQYLQKARKN